MKITLNQLLVAEKSLAYLKDKPVRPILARRIVRIINCAMPHLNEYRTVERETIIRLGEKEGDGDGAQFRVKPENWQTYVDEMSELLKEEFDLDARPLTMDLLDKESDLKISPDVMCALGPLLVESE